MSPSFDIDRDDLPLFAMHLLSADEAEGIRVRLERSSEFREELGDIQGGLALYAFTAEMHTPPAMARERLLNQVSRERKLRAPEREASGQRPISNPAVPHFPHTGQSSPVEGRKREPLPARSLLEEEPDGERQPILLRLLPWTGWAVAAGLAVTAGNLARERNVARQTAERQQTELNRTLSDAAAARDVLETMTDPGATRVTLTRAHSVPVPQGKATYLPGKGALLFTASNLEPLLPYKVYELWVIPADGRAAIAAGTFHPDDHGNATVVLPEIPKGVAARAFGVTLEDEGGSATPTMPILLAGSAS